MLVDNEGFQCLDHGIGGVLGPQIGFQNVDVVFGPLQALAADNVDALQHGDDVEGGSERSERVGGTGGRLAVDVGEGSAFDVEPLKVSSGKVQVDSSPSWLTCVTSSTDFAIGIVTLSPMRGMGGGSGAVSFLEGLAMVQPA